MFRVVLDHAVLLRGLINPHSPCGSLLSKHSYRYRAIFSEETRRALLVLQLHPVLLAKHPHLLKINPRRAGRLAARAETVRLPSDRFDSAVIATALAARVDYIVSEDPALLDYHDRVDIPIVDAQTFINVARIRDQLMKLFAHLKFAAWLGLLARCEEARPCDRTSQTQSRISSTCSPVTIWTTA